MFALNNDRKHAIEGAAEMCLPNRVCSVPSAKRAFPDEALAFASALGKQACTRMSHFPPYSLRLFDRR